MSWFRKAIVASVCIGGFVALWYFDVWNENKILFALVALALAGIAWFLWDK